MNRASPSMDGIYQMVGLPVVQLKCNAGGGRPVRNTFSRCEEIQLTIFEKYSVFQIGALVVQLKCNAGRARAATVTRGQGRLTSGSMPLTLELFKLLCLCLQNINEKKNEYTIFF